eukprot:TRINITY_DN48852_c0_g1_i1.p1 TRINITY_DN48852_c0_g1~~TRINITY_DN48852_c0_g1_i1.p1  ORF type:complete len:241 (+),score=23.83 TRINITY_DN48852_c0_g1_i1:58-780(+)
MKKTLVVLLLLSLSLAFGIESEPSEVVGFVKFSCVTVTNNTNLNHIALPLESGYTMASEVAAAVTGCDAVSKWNAASQSWASAVPLVGVPGTWLGDFAVSANDVLMVSLTNQDVDFYVTGTVPASPSYNFVTTDGTNLNHMILPLDKGTITNASSLAGDITNVDAISKWNAATQSWTSAVPLVGVPGTWLGDFDISIGMPYVVSVTNATMWPATPALTPSVQNNLNNFKIQNINTKGAKK